MKISIHSTKGEWVGDVETDDKTYYTQRNANLGQVFHFFDNALAVDVFIVKQLLRLKCEFICITVVGLEERTFYAISTIHNFLEASEKINYDKRNEFGQSYTGYGEQMRMGLRFWRKAYSLQDIERVRKEVQLVLNKFV